MRYIVNGLMLMSLTIPALNAQADVLDLGVAGNYNIFIFNDFTSQNTDVQGAVAVGGNLNVSSYSVNENNQAVNGNALVVGNNLTYSNGSVKNGNIYAGGSVSTASFGFTGTYVSANPVNFANEETYLKNLSTNISQVAQTGTFTTAYSGIQLTASNNATAQVFDISGSAFNASNNITFSGFSAGQTIILNISGTNVAFNGGNGTNFNGYNVLFNFYQATSLNTGSGADGSVLAPLADVTGGYSQITGNVIANSWNTNTQVNLGAFKSTDIPGLTAVTPVPEAETWSLLLVGMGVVGWVQRRRKYVL